MESEFIVSAAEYTENSQINYLALEEKGNILASNIAVKQRIGSFTRWNISSWSSDCNCIYSKKVKGKMQ